MGLLHEVFQPGQWQVVEADGAQLADDARIAGVRQWEAAGQFALGVVQFLLGRAVLEVVGKDTLHQLECALAEFGTGLQVDHERAAHLHRAEYRVYAVGQAAFFPHFAHQAGTEGAATENLVAQRQGWPVRVLAVDAQLGQHQVGLLGREVDVGGACLGLDGLRRLGQCRAFGQGGGDLGGNRLGLFAAEVADQCDYRVARCIGFGVECAQLFQGDARDAFSAAVAWMGVRVVAVKFAEQRLAGDLAGVLLLVFETGQQLVLDSFECVLREGRLAGYFSEQLQGRLALVLHTQAAQRGHRHVAVGAVAEVCAEPFEAFGDGGHILAGNAFVEHGIGQGGQARRVAVLAAAGGEGHAQIEHRQLAGLDEQYACTFGSGPVLDVQLAPAGGLAVQLGQRLQGIGGAGRGAVGFGVGRASQDAGHRHHQCDDARADQGVAWCAAITHERTPQAVHGQRSGVRG
ncbi:hypothetical protein D3C78_1013750 [compost metagenome]